MSDRIGCVACFMGFQQEVSKLLCDHSAYWYKKISRLPMKKSNKLLNFSTAAEQIAWGNRRKRASCFLFPEFNLSFSSIYPRLFFGNLLDQRICLWQMLVYQRIASLFRPFLTSFYHHSSIRALLQFSLNVNLSIFGSYKIFKIWLVKVIIIRKRYNKDVMRCKD